MTSSRVLHVCHEWLNRSCIFSQQPSPHWCTNERRAVYQKKKGRKWTRSCLPLKASYLHLPWNNWNVSFRYTICWKEQAPRISVGRKQKWSSLSLNAQNTFLIKFDGPMISFTYIAHTSRQTKNQMDGFPQTARTDPWRASIKKSRCARAFCSFFLLFVESLLHFWEWSWRTVRVVEFLFQKSIFWKAAVFSARLLLKWLQAPALS